MILNTLIVPNHLCGAQSVASDTNISCSLLFWVPSFFVITWCGDELGQQRTGVITATKDHGLRTSTKWEQRGQNPLAPAL